MNFIEYYYKVKQYDRLGINPYLNHINEFLNGNRTVPVVKAPSILGNDLLFTFSSDLFISFRENFEKIKKPYECALKYGFRGYSRGGKNGIFLIRKTDIGLLQNLDNSIDKYKVEIVSDLDCTFDDIEKLKKVKIVYHNSLGERIVGLMNEKNNRAIFLEFAFY